MESHIKIVVSENSNFSEKILDESNTLNEHKEFEKCDICSESFSNKRTLGIHKSLVHLDDPQYIYIFVNFVAKNLEQKIR